MSPKSNPFLPVLRFALCVLVLPLLFSCDSLPDMDKEPDPDPDEKFDFVERNRQLKLRDDEKKPADLIGEPDAAREKVLKQAEKLSDATPPPATVDGRAPAKPAGAEKLPGAKASRFYEDFILLDGDRKVEVAMTFNSAPLVDVIAAFADVLEFNFLADSDLKGVVTLNLNSTISKRELWETFDNMLQLAGAGALNSNQLLRIMNAGKLPKQSDLRVANLGTGNSEVIFYLLKNLTAHEALTQLKGFLSASGTIAEVARSNIVVVCDSSDNIPKLRSILEVLDQPGRRMWPRAVVFCEKVLPSKIAAELSEILPVIGLPVTLANSRSETPGAVYLTGLDRLQLVVVSAATAEVIAQVRDWVKILDNTDSDEQERVYVYKVANSKAEQLAQALSVVFTTQGSSLTIDTTRGTNRTQQLTTQTNKVTATGNTGSTAFTKLATNNDLNTTTELTSTIFTTPVRIFADGIYNRLVVRTTPRTYGTIKALLDRLDTVPAQVLLQILIVEVNLDDSNEFGVEFNALGENGSTVTSVGTKYNGMNKDTGGDGLNFAIANANNPDEKFAYVHALAGRNKVKVISSPQLLVSSNTEAKINIGDEVPIVTGSVTLAESNTGNASYTYTYRETGIIMTITPQVTSTDMIVLEVKQEVSKPVKNTYTSATETPVIQQRVIETAMTIANGKTMIMGGLIQEKMADDLSSVPILADIPFVGRLFGNTSQSTQRTEMLVLVTGYIVNEKSPVEEMIKRYNVAVKDLSKFEAAIADQHAGDLKREAEIRVKKLQEVADAKAGKTSVTKAAPTAKKGK